MTQEDDLPAKIHEWLRHEGYPFEMRVAQAFRNVGFHVTQSDYYIDPETQTPREIDVVATIQKATKDGPVFRIEFLIECKSSKDKPWLLLSAPEEIGFETFGPGEVAQRIASMMGTQVLSELAQDGNIQQLALFSLRAPVGYALTQAFKKEKDIAYAAMYSVAHAAWAGSRRWKGHTSESSIVEFIFPVIAIDGRLFDCTLGWEDDISVNEITWATLLWGNALPPLSSTIIDVQTESSITSFAEESYESARTLLTNHYDIVQNILTKAKR